MLARTLLDLNINKISITKVGVIKCPLWWNPIAIPSSKDDTAGERVASFGNFLVQRSGPFVLLHCETIIPVDDLATTRHKMDGFPKQEMSSQNRRKSAARISKRECWYGLGIDVNSV